MKKLLLIALLTLCMAFTLLPVSAMAEATAPMSVSGEAAITVATEDALHAAITQVEDGEAIVLGSNIALHAAVTIAEDNVKSFRLDLKGYTLSSDGESAISHSGSGTLTITDSTPEKNGKVMTTAPRIDTISLSGGSQDRRCR